MASVHSHRSRLQRLLFHAPWLGCLLWLLLTGRRHIESTVQPGPLAGHGHQGLDCHMCHATGAGLFRQLPSGSLAMDERCLQCHSGHAVHHPQQLISRTPRCVHCHREHHGRERITGNADQWCTACHAEIRKENGEFTDVLPVSSWSAHPEFAVLRDGPAQGDHWLHFSHRAHLAPDGFIATDNTQTALKCAVCHLPEPSQRHWQPVCYEKSCATCHPNWVRLSEEQESVAAIEFRRRPAAHAEPKLVRAELRDRLVQLVRQAPELLSEGAEPDLVIPWKPPRSTAQEQQWKWVERQLAGLETQLFRLSGGCGLCHDVTVAKDGRGSMSRKGSNSHAFKRASFNHYPHRNFACTVCHDLAASATLADVKLPSIMVCAGCHVEEQPTTCIEARATCSSCHRYHPASRK